MNRHPLAAIRTSVRSIQDAIYWACLLEATSPKAGNVHPSESFSDLDYASFVTAAKVTSVELTRPDLPLSWRMRSAVTESQQATSTNVNLGIVLLLGPLVEASMQSAPDGLPKSRCDLALRLPEILASLSTDDGKVLYEAIRIVNPGGLKDESLSQDEDVGRATGPVDFVSSMKLASRRDRVALQYSTDYQDLLQHIVPIVSDAINQTGDVLAGISQGQLTLLSEAQDSLIHRKNGDQVAASVQNRAREVTSVATPEWFKFDRWLREDGNRLNPGTTADLIAAALYVLLIAHD